MIRSKETIKKADEIYDKRGFESQLDQLIEEFAELFLALVRFRKHPIEKNRENLLEEIGDYEFVKLQLDRNTRGEERHLLLRTAARQEGILQGEGLKELWINTRKNQRIIEKVAAEKADRTLERISQGYYV